MSQVAATSPSANIPDVGPAFKPLSRHDVAAILNVTVRTVENWRAKGLIAPGVSFGGRVYWHPDVFYASLDAKLRPDILSGGENVVSIQRPATTLNRPPAATRALKKARSRTVAAIAAMTDK